MKVSNKVGSGQWLAGQYRIPHNINQVSLAKWLERVRESSTVNIFDIKSA